jgi:hypothetical protein
MSKNATPSSPQASKFIEAARELGCDEDAAHFEDKLKKIAQHKPSEKSESKISKKK